MIWLFALIIPVIPASAMTRGEYLVNVGGCVHCHTNKWYEPMAGQRRLDSPFGAFYPPNITPDLETGIGKWTEVDFFRAMRDGISPAGSPYYPAFPYRAYSAINDEDLRAIFEYLRSVPPINKERLAHEIEFPFDQRWLVNFWQLLYFSKPKPPESRGEYLVEALGHCTECHTPRNALGALEKSKWLSGSPVALGGWIAPNITPDLKTGLGAWSAKDWQIFLSSGVKPSGKTAGGEMAFVLRGLAELTDEDRAAMIQYLKNLSPIPGIMGTQ
jgi:mono/diheme cytochrome c family protein